jgi:hypothetical protein
VAATIAVARSIKELTGTILSDWIIMGRRIKNEEYDQSEKA